MNIELFQGDITELDVDAVVNAANTTLLGGGGVDGAIHRAAGPQLLEECRKFNGCNTGEAVITGAYNLPCKYVIHTPGPVWRGGNRNEAELLQNCYLNSLKLATEYRCKSIAFPGISTGVYSFPAEQAAKIAYTTVSSYSEYLPERVIFVAFSKENFNIYNKLLSDQKAAE